MMTQQAETDKQALYESRAPGWIMLCTSCGHTEPWGKYAIRIGAKSIGKFTLRRCPGCKRIRFQSITKKSVTKETT